MDRSDRPHRVSTTHPGTLTRLLALVVLGCIAVGLPIWYGSSVPALYELAVGSRPEWPTPILERVVPLTERSSAREPWERTYMHAVSAVGVVWVVVRTIRTWRIDRERLVLVPRSRERARGDPNPSEAAGRSRGDSVPTRNRGGGDGG